MNMISPMVWFCISALAVGLGAYGAHGKLNFDFKWMINED